MRRWAPAVPIAIGIGFSAAVHRGLPEQVEPGWGEILPLITSSAEAMPRTAAVVLFPAVAVLVWVILAAGARIPGRLMRDAIDRFGGTYATVTTGVVGLVILLHLLLLSTITDWPGWSRKALAALFGVGLITVGNVLPRLRTNLIAGIRTPATLRDDRLWARTHRWLGILLVGHGVLVVVIALIAPKYALAATMLSMLSASVGAHFAGRRVVARPANPKDAS